MARRASDLPVFNAPQLTAVPSRPASVKSFSTDSTCVSIDGYDESKNPNTSSSRCSSASCLSRQGSTREYLFDWIVKVLGILAAILFGIWAPVSYRAQTSGNASNDDAQAYLNTKIDGLYDEIKELGEDLDELRRVVEFDTRLKVWQFCDQEQRRDLPACRTVLNRYEINSIISDLAQNPTHRLSSRSANTPPASTPTIAESLSRKTEIPVPKPTSTMLSDDISSSYASQSSHGTGPLNTTPALPSSGGTFSDDILRGEVIQMAAGMAFVLGIVIVMGVVGGWKVAKRNRRRGWVSEKNPHSQ